MSGARFVYGTTKSRTARSAGARTGVQTSYKIRPETAAQKQQREMANAAFSGYMKRDQNPYSSYGMSAKDVARRAHERMNEGKRWQQEMQKHAGNEQWAAVRARVAAKKAKLKEKREMEIRFARMKAASARMAKQKR